MSINRQLVLAGEYGSVAQGTATEDSDHDYMAIFLEDEEEVIGLEGSRSFRHADAADGERSKAGESDITYHSLRKFAALAAKGNPTVGSILFLPEYQYKHPVFFDVLMDIKDAFYSRRAGFAYLGYLNAQIKAIETRKGARPELVEKHGYDVKFAYHAYRLGIQGMTYMSEMRPELPLVGPHLRTAKEIRAGEWGEEDVLGLLGRVRQSLESIMDNSKLHIPSEPDYAKINRTLIEIHQGWWNGNY